MLDFETVRSEYPPELDGFDRAVLREFLQVKVLQAIFESNVADRLSLTGGTLLRLIHGSGRFAEEIRLEDFGLGRQGFDTLVGTVRRFLELEGFEVELRRGRGAFRCHLRYPDRLFNLGFSPLRKEEFRIRVGRVAEEDQYPPEFMILDMFDVFTQIRAIPVNLLLSQKIYTAVNRERPRGRDFYDISFLLGSARPDMGFLREKLGVETVEDLRWTIVERMDRLDTVDMAEEVAPYLPESSQLKRMEAFRATWEWAELG